MSSILGLLNEICNNFEGIPKIRYRHDMMARYSYFFFISAKKIRVRWLSLFISTDYNNIKQPLTNFKANLLFEPTQRYLDIATPARFAIKVSLSKRSFNIDAVYSGS